MGDMLWSLPSDAGAGGTWRMLSLGNSRGQPLGVWGPTWTPTCTTPTPVHPRVRVIPTGVGVLTLRGFTPGWGTYPLIHKYIGKNIVLLFTIYNKITMFVWVLSASRHRCHHHLCPAVIVIVIVIIFVLLSLSLSLSSSLSCCHRHRHHHLAMAFAIGMASLTSLLCWHGRAGTIVVVVFVMQGQE